MIHVLIQSRIFRAALLGLFILLTRSVTVAAQTDLIEAGASENYFYIEPNFDGTSVVLFGSIDRDRIQGNPFDLAITIRGPATPATVWEKQHRFGIWINSKSVTFEGVPSFYGVTSTKPIEQIAPFAERKTYEVGIDALPLLLDKKDRSKESLKSLNDFRAALIRIKTANGVFVENTSAVEFLGKTLFRARIFLPASAGPGLYSARTFLLQNGKVIGSTTSHVRLQKVGIEAFLTQTSTANPWLYGASAVLLAAAIGGGTSLLFRRR